jgi:hypothetical protein
MMVSSYKTLGLLGLLSLQPTLMSEETSPNPDQKAPSNKTYLQIETLDSDSSLPPSEPKASTLMTEMTLSGLVQVEAYYQKHKGLDSKSDLVVDSAQLNFSGRLTPKIETFVSVLYEESVGTLGLDVAKIEWQECGFSQLNLSLGKDYLSNISYDTLLISDPLVRVLSETSESLLKLTWQQNWAHYSVTVFNGDVDRGDRVNNFVLEAGIQPCKGFSAGISYTNNFLESDTLQDDLTALANEKIGGYNGFMRINLGDVSVISEFSIASQKLKAGTFASTAYAAKPQAYRVETDLALSETLDLGLTVEGSYNYEPLPKLRYGLVTRKALRSNFGVGLEVLNNQGRSSPDFLTTTAQLSLSF